MSNLGFPLGLDALPEEIKARLAGRFGVPIRPRLGTPPIVPPQTEAPDLGQPKLGTIPESSNYPLGNRPEPALPQMPTRNQFPEKPMSKWRTALGLLSSAAAGINDPAQAGTAARYVLGAPHRAAEEQYQQALGEWQEGQKAATSAAQRRDFESQARLRDAQTDALRNPTEKDQEHWTIVAGASGPNGELIQEEQKSGQLRFAPLEGASAKPKPAKHSVGEVKLDEGIPTGVYGENDKLWRANDPNMPPELKDALGDAMGAHKQKVGEQLTQAREGRAVLAGARAVNMITPNGTLVAVNGEDLPRFMRENPGSVEVGAGAGTQAMNKQALLSDIRRASGEVRKNLSVLDRKGFDYAKLGAALADPSSTAGAYLQSIPRGSLDDQGQQFVSDLFSLREQAMAMRAVLGAGQGSEDMRRAIIQTLPGISSGSSNFGKKQLDNLDAALRTLERGVPKTPMRSESTPEQNRLKSLGAVPR